jgi:hypothetical protein
MNKLILNIVIIIFTTLGAINITQSAEPAVLSDKVHVPDVANSGLLAENSLTGKDSTQQSKVSKDTSSVAGKTKNKSGKCNFIDLNGDGINDNCMSEMGKGKAKGKDCFIDKDGDGINDNRCQGSGFCKQKRQRKCCPKGK